MTAANPYADRLACLSVIVPVYNEEVVLPLFFSRLMAVLDTLPINHEIVFVDDGSRDGSVGFIAGLCAANPKVRLIKLSRNFGKESALTAGIDHATGDAAIIIDADLQDPPEEIPRMVAAWREGVDVVTMKRSERAGETPAKRFSAWLFYRLLGRMSRQPIPHDTGDFRLISRKAMDLLRQLTERNRYMKGLFAWIGLPTRELLYLRDPRAAGETKWNYLKLTGLALEGITSFSIAPLRAVTLLGLFAATSGLLFGAAIITKTLFMGEPVHGYPSLVAIVTFLGGVQLLGIGLLGEYVGKTYFESKGRPIYLIENATAAASTNQTASVTVRQMPG